jgi:hypothetical protein
MKIVGIFVIVLVLGLSLFNALFMLISPSKWFNLPEWVSLRGYFNKEVYGHGWGAIQVRLAGLAIAALIGFMLYSTMRAR